jgi:RNA polymerase sigma-70 factor (ECF subfamily)
MQPSQDFSTLYADFRGRIYRHLRRLTQDDGLAEDLTQETFLRAVEHLHTFRGEGRPGNWLYRIATNLFHDYVRAQSGKKSHAWYAQECSVESDEPLSQIPDPRPSLPHLLDGRAMTQCVRDCVAGLPSPYRAALALYALEEKTVDESATMLGCSKEALKVRLHRGRQLFKALVTERCDITAERGGTVNCEPKDPHRHASPAEEL